MTAERWTPERRRQLTREALVESARDVFAQRGFHAASLEEIAEAAGFTRGAVYSNFENKEELFFAVLDRHVELQLAAFDALFEESGGPVAASDEDVVRVWRQLATGSDPQWAALSLEFRLYALRNHDVRDRFLARYHAYRDRIASYLSDILRDLDRELLIPVTHLVAIVDWGAGGIMELGLLDPGQADVLRTFLDVLNHGAFGQETGGE
ncbi:MAG TPA: TetR/AcrR family transcriptional regulator [Acidimicrobiales bacterium]|nr:TetR/AcrR family transcriptional regulator [Acidimicrobiales bacterium]